MYAIRITRTAAELAALWERLGHDSIRIIAYEHNDGARPHVHVYLEGCTVSTDTLKNRIKKSLSVTTFAKSDWSFKGADGDLKVITYMSKGILEPIHNKGFDPEEVRRLKGNWLNYATLLKTHPKKPVQPKLNASELVDEIVKRFRAQERHVDSFDRVMDLAISIAHQVLYVEANAVIGRFKFRDYVDTVMARLSDTYPWIPTQINFMRYRL